VRLEKCLDDLFIRLLLDVSHRWSIIRIAGDQYRNVIVVVESERQQIGDYRSIYPFFSSGLEGGMALWAICNGSLTGFHLTPHRSVAKLALLYIYGKSWETGQSVM